MAKNKIKVLTEGNGKEMASLVKELLDSRLKGYATTTQLNSVKGQAEAATATANNAFSAASSNTSQLSTLNGKVSTLETKLGKYPEAPTSKDGKVRALVDGAWDDICPSGYDISVKKKATAASLALKSLEEGQLVVTGADENMIAEMRELMGPERFDELAANSVQTMELKPQPSIEEQIEAAKRAYDERKAAEQKDEIGVMKDERAEDVSSADVEPKNREQS